MSRQNFAMFVNIDGEWRFEGFAASMREVNDFKSRVSQDVAVTADAEVKTLGEYVIEMPDVRNDLSIMDLVVNSRYRVKYILPGTHTPRWGVIRFLSREGTSTLWSARPAGGTLRFEKDWIRSIRAALPGQETCIDQIWNDKAV